MTMQARGHRVIATVWQSKKISWHWWVLAFGYAQPKRFCWLDKYRFRFHLTPIHLERWGTAWEIGLCWGKKTVYLMRHK